MRSSALRVLLVTVGCVLGGVTSGSAQTCARFEAQPSTASVRIAGPSFATSGVPAQFCPIVPGATYDLFLRARGYESRHMKFSLKSDNTLDLSGVQFGHAGRSLLIPGWGQWHSGNKWRSSWAFIVGAYFWIDAGATYFDARDWRERADDTAALAATTATPEIQQRLLEEVISLDRRADTEMEHFYETVALAGYVHLGNVLEAWLLSAPPKVVSKDGNSAVLATARYSNSRAVWRSFLFPGFGQKYVGSYLKGWLFQTGFLVSAVFTLEARKDFRRADDGYTAAVEQLDQATSVSEVDIARIRAAVAWDERREKRRILNAFYIASGTVWVLNVLDAAFSTKLESEYGFNHLQTSFNGTSIETAFRLEF